MESAFRHVETVSMYGVPLAQLAHSTYSLSALLCGQGGESKRVRKRDDTGGKRRRKIKNTEAPTIACASRASLRFAWGAPYGKGG